MFAGTTNWQKSAFNQPLDHDGWMKNTGKVVNMDYMFYENV
jgi:hypothetical protein